MLRSRLSPRKLLILSSSFSSSFGSTRFDAELKFTSMFTWSSLELCWSCNGAFDSDSSYYSAPPTEPDVESFREIFAALTARIFKYLSTSFSETLSSSLRIFLVNDGGSIVSSTDCSLSIRFNGSAGLFSIFFSSPRVNYAIFSPLNSVRRFRRVSSQT